MDEPAEVIRPTPYDPTILVFRHVPWITEPGLYLDVTTEEYMRDPVVGGSVTSSTLKILHEQSPAHAYHYLTKGRPPKDYFDLGSAVHVLTLGEGRELAVWDGTWQTKEGKAFKQAAYAADKIPVLAEQGRAIRGMVAALRAHPRLAPWLPTGQFTAEVVVVWRDEDTGMMCRAMLDAVPHFSQILRAYDIKTCQRADPDSISRALVSYRYDMQRAHYVAGLYALRDLGLLTFAEVRYDLAFVEKDAPHVVTVRPIGEQTQAWAAEHRRDALRRLRDCKESGVWPGFDSPDPADENSYIPIEAPYWALRRWENR